MSSVNAVLMFLAISLVGCNSDSEQDSEAKDFRGPLVCDFTMSHQLANLSTPGIDNGYAVVYKGKIAVTLKLSEDRDYIGDAFLVTAKKGKNGEISLFHITTQAGTLEEMHVLARKILKKWRLPEKDLEDWVGKASSKPDSPFLFESISNKSEPPLSLSFHRSLVEEKPWCLFLEVHWP